MKKKITLGLVAVFAMATASAQNISIDDFEGGVKNWEEGVYPLEDEGELTVGPAEHFAIVDNPWPDGINDTEKSGEFTSQGKPTLFGVTIGREIYFSRYPTIRLTAMAGIGSGESNSLKVVVYNDEEGYEASGIGKTFAITGEEEWNVIEFNVSDYPSKPGYYNRIGFLFNPDTWADNYGVFVLDEIELVAATETIPDVLLRETFGFPNAEENYWRGDGDRVTIEAFGERFDSWNDADISCITNDAAGLKIGNLWLVFTDYQPYKDTESLCAGLDKDESLTFSNIYAKDITNITVSFGFLVWAGWQDMDASWAPQMRPTVEASVDGGNTWTTLTTQSAFMPEEQVQLNDEYFGYAISSWFLLEYPVPLTGDNLAIRISNQNAEAHTFYVDNIIIKGFVGQTGLENIQASKVKAFVSNNLLTVNAGNVKEIVVYNVAGNKLASKHNTNTLEVSSFPKGVYIASVVLENNQTAVVKFIK